VLARFTLPGPRRNATRELERFEHYLLNGERFTFVRFSDGECEVLEGNPLEISDSGVNWSRGSSQFRYPAYDFKSFDPIRDSELRAALVSCAQFQSPAFYKGIPTRHNNSPGYSKMIFELNGGSCDGLTFADIFINSNYKRFVSSFLPILKGNSNVALIGNFRMQPALVNPRWKHHKIGDNLFGDFLATVESSLAFISTLPPDSIVLSSASSITNVLGKRVHEQRLPITFIDIGTALHPFMGLVDSRREYQSQLQPWTKRTLRGKFGYHLARSSRIRW
jgi:hypothetical protein